MNRTTVIITDLTRMGGDRVCLAGYTEDGMCIRPELPYGAITESWLFAGGKAIVRPFAAIELELDRHRPHPPHTEDWVIRPGPPIARGMVAPGERITLLNGIADPDVQSIFGAPVQHEMGWWVAAETGQRSLGTVRARVWDVFHEPKPDGGWDYRLVFTDTSGDRYRLSVTDLAFRYFLDHERTAGRISGHGSADSVTHAFKASRELYLRVGLARGNWSKFPSRCYLQINGVYSFPDYLDGRCFADFAPVPELDLEALPF